MPGSQNTSFIPKHTTNKAVRKSSPQQLFIGTLIIRIFFFAVVVAAVGVYFYERQLIKQQGIAVDTFQQAVDNFAADEEKLQAVITLNNRLVQANTILSESYSLLPILSAFETNTLQTAQITGFEFEKKDDQTLSLALNISTDNFDSVLFQRSLYEQSVILKEFMIENISVNNLTQSGTTVSTGNNNPGQVTNDEGGIEVEAIITLVPTDVPVVANQEALIGNSPTLVPVSESANDNASANTESLSNEPTI